MNQYTKRPNVITFKKVGLKRAQKLFPGSVTEDIKDLHKINRLEKGYHTLVVLDGKLYSCTYEISYLGWSVWDGDEWRDLVDVDSGLWDRLGSEDVQLEWK